MQSPRSCATPNPNSPPPPGSGRRRHRSEPRLLRSGNVSSRRAGCSSAAMWGRLDRWRRSSVSPVRDKPTMLLCVWSRLPYVLQQRSPWPGRATQVDEDDVGQASACGGLQPAQPPSGGSPGLWLPPSSTERYLRPLNRRSASRCRSFTVAARNQAVIGPDPGRAPGPAKSTSASSGPPNSAAHPLRSQSRAPADPP